MCNVARTHTNHTMKSNVSSSARVCAFPWKSGKICCWLLNAYEHTHNMELPATRYALHYCNCRSVICWKCELMYSHHHRRMRLLCASIENNEFDLNSVLFSSSSFFLIISDCFASFFFCTSVGWPPVFFSFCLYCFYLALCRCSLHAAFFPCPVFVCSFFTSFCFSLGASLWSRMSSLKAPHIIRQLKTNRLYSKVIYESAVSRVLTFDKWTRRDWNISSFSSHR